MTRRFGVEERAAGLVSAHADALDVLMAISFPLKGDSVWA